MQSEKDKIMELLTVTEVKDGGEDFRAVLEKVTNANIPMPASGKWATAGMVRGGRLTQLGESLTLNYRKGRYPIDCNR